MHKEPLSPLSSAINWNTGAWQLEQLIRGEVHVISLPTVCIFAWRSLEAVSLHPRLFGGHDHRNVWEPPYDQRRCQG